MTAPDTSTTATGKKSRRKKQFCMPNLTLLRLQDFRENVSDAFMKRMTRSLETRKKAKVVVGLEGGQPSQSLSRNAQVWFKQDLFGGVDIEDVEDDENDDDEADDEDGEEEEDSDEEPSDSTTVRGLNRSNRLCVLTV